MVINIIIFIIISISCFFIIITLIITIFSIIISINRRRNQPLTSSTPPPSVQPSPTIPVTCPPFRESLSPCFPNPSAPTSLDGQLRLAVGHCNHY